MLLGMESPVVTQSFRLPNGLGVVLSPGTGETGAAIRLRYYAGRKDDPPGRAGLAHIVEHLMFHGTPNGGSGSFYQNMERVGPDVNANVGDDATDYFEQVPRSAVERALWLEADRMAHAVVRFDERGLQIEREAVRNELRERSTTYPEHAAHRLAASLVFGAGHPYGGHDGDAKTLDAISLEDARAFGRAHYHPGNATLVVSGDFDPATTRDAVIRYFARVPSGERRRPRSIAAPKLEADRTLIQDNGTGPTLVVMAWPAPPPDADGFHQLSFATDALQGRATAILVNGMHIAKEVSVHLEGGHLGSLLTITVTMHPGVALSSARYGLERSVAWVASLGRLYEWEHFDELRRARAAHRFLLLADPATRAYVIHEDLEYDATPDALRRDLSLMQEMHAADVGSAVAQFLAGAHHALVHIKGDERTKETR